jgi:predicted metalloprotease with PDZ domain
MSPGSRLQEDHRSPRRALRHVRARHSLCLLGCLSFVASLPAADKPTAYTLSPQMQRDALRAISVEVRMTADPSGRTPIDLPDQFAGVTGHYKRLSAMKVQGGTVSHLDGKTLVIASKPAAGLTIRYTVHGAFELADPTTKDQNLYAGSVVRPTWFEALGEFFIIQPQGRDNEPARLAWRGWPQKWLVASSEDNRDSTLDDIVEATYLAGSDINVRTLPIAGGTLRVASHGTFDWSVDDYAERLAKLISAQRDFWDERLGDYMVTLVALDPSPGNHSSGGTGRRHGFVQYIGPGIPDSVLLRTIAHEHTHNWIPNRVGVMPENDERALYWFSEGFTDFYGARTLLRSGLWTPQQFIDDLSLALNRLAESSVRNVQNSQITKDFWGNREIQQLPYDRGRLFAHLLDYELKRAGKPGLDAVMFAMRDRWRAASDNDKPPFEDNLFAVLDASGFDVRRLVARYIENGETIKLPQDLFGSCATVATSDAGRVSVKLTAGLPDRQLSECADSMSH